MKTQLRQSLILLLTAAIWGTSFVAQSVGMDYVGPFTFNSIRSLLGGLCLIPAIFLLDRLKYKNESVKPEYNKKRTLTGGVCCGIVLCLASNLQQIGMTHTTVGKAGFITACYIVLVPVLGIFLRKKAGLKVWASVALAVGGLYLLCITDGLSIQPGDLYVMGCSLLFAVHILVIDHFSEGTDGVRMSCVQFLVSGILSAIPMLLFEDPTFSAVCVAWMPILYAGLLSCGVGYTLQIIGQKNMNPTVASLILSLESVVAVLAGWILLGQALTLRETCGCILMLEAIVLAQLPGRKPEKA